jgi:uncharacterized phage-associated protein
MKLITNDEIKLIIEKYNIGKRPLSIILGLGEVTITRYLSDDSKPNSQISELLFSVLNDPGTYLEYLEKNKDKISSIAYGKSKTSTLKLLNIYDEKDELLDSVSEYIIKYNPETTNLTLQKLLYYCQLFSYVLFDKPMFKSKCSAWQHGPVFEEVYYKYKINGNNPIENKTNVYLDDNVKKVVETVIDNFGCFSGAVLCYFTHSESPWKVSYNSGIKINEEAMENFARKIKEEYNINDTSDIENYVKASIDNFKKNRGEN